MPIRIANPSFINTSGMHLRWRPSCNSLYTCRVQAAPGCHLTTLFDNTAIQPATAAPSQSRGWLPLLTVLFLISYGLMTLLIVEQGETIANQRALIRDLFRDSAELSGLKARAAGANAARHSGQTNKDSLTQDPAVQPPSTQAPSKNPSSQAIPQHRAQTHGGAPKQFKIPSRPASDLADERRSLITI